jgi:hypothetical protein
MGAGGRSQPPHRCRGITPHVLGGADRAKRRQGVDRLSDVSPSTRRFDDCHGKRTELIVACPFEHGVDRGRAEFGDLVPPLRHANGPIRPSRGVEHLFELHGFLVAQVCDRSPNNSRADSSIS